MGEMEGKEDTIPRVSSLMPQLLNPNSLTNTSIQGFKYSLGTSSLKGRFSYQGVLVTWVTSRKLTGSQQLSFVNSLSQNSFSSESDWLLTNVQNKEEPVIQHLNLFKKQLSGNTWAERDLNHDSNPQQVCDFEKITNLSPSFAFHF